MEDEGFRQSDELDANFGFAFLVALVAFVLAVELGFLQLLLDCSFERRFILNGQSHERIER